jgi:hypothetical protein
MTKEGTMRNLEGPMTCDICGHCQQSHASYQKEGDNQPCRVKDCPCGEFTIMRVPPGSVPAGSYVDPGPKVPQDIENVLYVIEAKGMQFAASKLRRMIKDCLVHEYRVGWDYGMEAAHAALTNAKLSEAEERKAEDKGGDS